MYTGPTSTSNNAALFVPLVSPASTGGGRVSAIQKPSNKSAAPILSPANFCLGGGNCCDHLMMAPAGNGRTGFSREFA